MTTAGGSAAAVPALGRVRAPEVPAREAWPRGYVGERGGNLLDMMYAIC